MEKSVWADAGGVATPSNEVEVVHLEEVEVEEVEWLWLGFIPDGKLSVIEVNSASEKSTVILDIAACITTGRALPDGSVCQSLR